MKSVFLFFLITIITSISYIVSLLQLIVIVIKTYKKTGIKVAFFKYKKYELSVLPIETIFPT